MPKESREAFRLLADSRVISSDLASRLGEWRDLETCGVHEYQRLDINLMLDVIEHRIGDLLQFVDRIVSRISERISLMPMQLAVNGRPQAKRFLESGN
jgi:uncharacterized protein YutE (UPF0331/DUF86 family)